MAALDNPKHERFAQEVAKGRSNREAYASAGYATTNEAATDASASRLLSDAKVQGRIAEIQEHAAKRVEISVASVTESLLRIAKKAEALSDSPGLSVARAAHMDAAKLNGLVVDKTDNTHRGTVNLSDDELLDVIASGGRNRTAGEAQSTH